MRHRNHDPKPVNGATAAAVCGASVVVAIYPSHALAENDFVVQSNQEGSLACMAVGGNWTLLAIGDPGFAQRVAAALHAEYKTG
jgi:hypothetical protein